MTNNQFQESEFLLYKAADGEVKIEVLVQDERAWLTQKKILYHF